MRFFLTAGQRQDGPQALTLIDGLPARYVIADRAYDWHAILDGIEEAGAKPVIPQKPA